MLIGQSAQAPAEELMAFVNQALALSSTSPTEWARRLMLVGQSAYLKSAATGDYLPHVSSRALM